MTRALMVALLGLSVAAAPACATKTFVRTEVGDANTRVDALTQALEQVQARVSQTEARVGQTEDQLARVDREAGAAAAAAAAARTAADGAASTAKEAAGRVDAIEAAARRLVYEVTLNEGEGGFAFGRSDLPAKARAHLDEVVEWLKTYAKPGVIEIEGHTDDVGPADVNKRVGLARAEAARAYLHEQHNLPLQKIDVMSYGEEKPVMPNRTAQGRAMNRRIVIRVLS